MRLSTTFPASRTAASRCSWRSVWQLLALVLPARASWSFDDSVRLPTGGFSSSFEDGVWGHCVQYYTNATGTVKSGIVVRFALHDFASVQVLDLERKDPELRGFVGGFHDGTWGYVVPFGNSLPSGDGKVARFHLHDFDTVEVLALADTDPQLKYFTGGFADDRWGYTLPRHNTKVGRFDLETFSSVEVLDLAATDAELTQFRGGFAHGTWGYLVPSAGKAARFSLDDFSAVQVLDLRLTNPDLRYFWGGFAHGDCGYLMSFAGPAAATGSVARFDLASFDNVTVLALAETDPDCVHFMTAFTDGSWGYAVPYKFKRSGKAARFALRDFSTVEVLDLPVEGNDSGLVGFGSGFFSGSYAYFVSRDQNHVARLSVMIATTSATATGTQTMTSEARTQTATTTRTTATTRTTTTTRTRTASATAASVAPSSAPGSGGVDAAAASPSTTQSSARGTSSAMVWGAAEEESGEADDAISPWVVIGVLAAFVAVGAVLGAVVCQKYGWRCCRPLVVVVQTPMPSDRE